MNIVKQSVELTHAASYIGALNLVSQAGGICYNSKKETVASQENFIKKLIKMDHGTPLEHVNISFRITTDRMTHVHLIRHRLASFNVESTRYNKYDEPNMILPIQFYNIYDINSEDIFNDRDDIGLAKFNIWLDNLENCINGYTDYLSLTNSTDEARILLPSSIETKMIMTANIREWRHIIKLRCSSKAHMQTRALMNMVKCILIDEYPIFFQDLEEIN